MVDGLINEEVLLLVNRPTTVCRDVHRRSSRCRPGPADETTSRPTWRCPRRTAPRRTISRR
jgi:hypothetical protein